MFEYVRDTHKVKVRIGQFVAHHVVQEKPFSKILRSVEQINTMNRYDLAKAFLESGEAKYFYRDVGECDPERLLDDVARYIDQRIPKAYITWDTEQEATSDWSAKARGLIYQFPEHADLEEEIKREAEAWKQETPATERQIKYLKSLLKNAGYCLNQIEELNVDEASQYIRFFVEDAPLPHELSQRLEYDI
ncbi:hypothetical protein [Paenibacillus chibensis]|uniref:hypothetical protein n=1 Tax=Paenibacillus chibensis TaxID=59846 RepID=UPI000FD854E7|nr:hypothetical protein [Paenibacillus chibensis]MEC0373330.1 hypothetical protein [Paenibacillus chibensis]